MIFLCLAHAKLVYIRGGHEVRTNIHACQCNIEMSVYIVRPASRAKTLSLSVSVEASLRNWLVCKLTG